MFVHRSNRLERLIGALADIVSRPLRDPFAADVIVVQGRGMERYVSQELAAKLGVWANPSFPFPRAFLEGAFDELLGARELGLDPFAPDTMALSVAAQLPRFASDPRFAALTDYARAESGATRRIELAQRVARVLDQYAVYRPDLCLAWSRGEEPDDWQAELFRALVARHGPDLLPTRAKRFVEALASGEHHLPERISLFSVTSLPPLYVDVLRALAARVDVHMFVLSPTAEYFADVRGPRERRTSTASEGHPLIASLGRSSRAFQDLLESAVDYVEPHALYEDPGDATLLRALQSDMLALSPRGRDGRPKLALRDDDDSIRIHSCHGPTRELEVLHDQLLDLFERDETLAPRDVIVLSPDIDAYGPAIDAVFGAEQRIPYRIADRSLDTTLEAFVAFERLLDFSASRFTAPATLDLLTLEPIRDRFGIRDDDVETIREWVRATGIRFGVDAAHRKELGLPEDDLHTFRFGIDRMLLGYAMPGTDMLAGCAPYDEIEGTRAELLGRFAEFIAMLAEVHHELGSSRTVAEWRGFVDALLPRTMRSSTRVEWQLELLASAVAELADRAQLAEFDEPIELRAFRSLLAPLLETRAKGHGFMSSGVTFCELVPMRSIPFRVVCLLGMSDGAFPRVQRAIGFDRMAKDPRPTDRSARDDDRQLFLEAILSARDHMIVTYVGQSIRDGSTLTPSVVVSELLDSLDESFTARDGVTSHVVVRHPLQPFSPRYFGEGDDRRLFSYSSARAGEAAFAARARGRPAPFVSARLPVIEDAQDLPLAELAAFVRHPIKYFLTRRVGLRLDESETALKETAPLEIFGLDTYALVDPLVRAPATHTDDASLLRRGLLPTGAPGRVALRALREKADPFLDAARELTLRGARRAIEIDVTIDGTRVWGRVNDIYGDTRLVSTYSRFKGTELLQLYVEHLACNLVDPAVRSVLMLRADDDKKHAYRMFELAPASEPRAQLGAAIALYRVGMTAPLPLFRRASFAYARARIRDRASDEAALAKASSQYSLGDDARAFAKDAGDPYVHTVYGDRELTSDAAPFADADVPAFADLAMRVFTPVFAILEETSR